MAAAWRGWRGTGRQEIVNALTHGAGVPLAVAGLVVLLWRALGYGDAGYTVSVAVYGLSLVAVYAASTLYHGAWSPRLKNVFLWLDHSCVYGLIAGTYTPFMTTALRGVTGTALLVTVWGLALLGVLSKTALRIRALRGDAVSLPVYIGMGWLIVLAIKPFMAAMEPGGLVLLAAGGLCYSAGVVFFLLRAAWAHAAWHVMVLAGSGLHYASVLLYATPR
ncbi:MAG TPA: hemolysin III family protein [Chloroflexota bacterium]|nr:hemolysin III family protein [Chloroflexota bacterium]